MSRLSSLVLLVCALARSSSAWSPAIARPRRVDINCSTTRLNASRRAFVAAAVTGSVLSTTLPAFAEGDKFDDLSMPSEDEAEKSAEDEMAERLRRKAELQRKASRPMGFGDSLKSEKEKQKDLQKSQEERRNALCEELGRGC